MTSHTKQVTRESENFGSERKISLKSENGYISTEI